MSRPLRRVSPRRAAAVLLLLAVAACAKEPPQDMVVVLADEDGKVGAVTIANARGTRVLDRPNVAADLAGDARSDLYELKQDEISVIFGDALAAEPLPPVQFLLRFQFGSDELTPASQAEIPNVVAAVQQRPAPDIAVIGHTDRAGSDDYNYRLSLRRAEKIRDLLIAAGADPALIAVSSHGENNPIIPTEDGVNEPENRRVEVSIR